MKKVGIIMGSDSDLPVLQKAADMLDELQIPYEAHVYSAHRTPEVVKDFAVNAKKNGFGAIIAAAGMAAHPGRAMPMASARQHIVLAVPSIAQEPPKGMAFQENLVPLLVTLLAILGPKPIENSLTKIPFFLASKK